MSSTASLVDYRSRHLASCISLSNKSTTIGPLNLVQGDGALVKDSEGRWFVDAINNVSHVGHCNQSVNQACIDALSTINTNSRYLSQVQHDYIKELLSIIPKPIDEPHISNQSNTKPESQSVEQSNKQSNNRSSNLFTSATNPLDTVFFCCSGSEANDLALRIARCVTSSNKVICVDHAYHGATQSTIEVSPYKFHDQGQYEPTKHPITKSIDQSIDQQLNPSVVRSLNPDVYVAEMPDMYRGRYRDLDRDLDETQAGEEYAKHVDLIVEYIRHEQQLPADQSIKQAVDLLISQSANQSLIAAFIVEPFQSCGGQLPLPVNYLQSVNQSIKKVGGLLIIDEIQTSLGRNGETWFEFERHGVQPDILTLGKNMGNGVALSVVVINQSINQAFYQCSKMEYFNTFAGSHLALAAGLATIKEIKQHQLIDNARLMGQIIIDGLKELQLSHQSINRLNNQSKAQSLIGDVRGSGLMIGVELVKCHRCFEPAAEEATKLCNYALSMPVHVNCNMINRTINQTDRHTSTQSTDQSINQVGIILSIDGPHHNVIKIKPPMVINDEQARAIVQSFRQSLKLMEREREDLCMCQTDKQVVRKVF